MYGILDCSYKHIHMKYYKYLALRSFRLSRHPEQANMNLKNLNLEIDRYLHHIDNFTSIFLLSLEG